MYILKNALVSIKRNVGRNLLIGIIVVVISCAVTITLAIRSSATSLINSYEDKYEVTASIGINRESMLGGMKPGEGMSSEDMEQKKENMVDIFSNISSISIDDIESYGNSKYVKNYYYQISVGVNSNDASKVSMDTSNSSRPSMPNMGGNMFSNKQNSDFTLTGYSSINAMEEFINGKYSIIEGTVSDEDNNCVINFEFATLNEIKVGDEINFYNPDNEDDIITLKVSGIYEETSDTSSAMGMFTNSANTIITNANIIESYAKEYDVSKTVTPTFVLINKNVIDSFSKELTEKGLSSYLSVSTNMDQVESATSTISNVKTFATTFLIITLVIGGVVLFVINMINIRERRYEIGVLRTIGMKKGKLLLQFTLELLIVSLISLVIGAGIGSASSVGVSNYLLKQEINNSTTEKDNIRNNFGGKDFDKVNGMVQIQAFDSIDAAVDVKVLSELLIIGLVLTLVSSSAAMISIQKFSPLTILKERS